MEHFKSKNSHHKNMASKRRWYGTYHTNLVTQKYQEKTDMKAIKMDRHQNEDVIDINKDKEQVRSPESLEILASTDFLINLWFLSYLAFMALNVLIWILEMYICIITTLYLHKCCITSHVLLGPRLQFSQFFTQYLLTHKVLMSLKKNCSSTF